MVLGMFLKYNLCIKLYIYLVFLICINVLCNFYCMCLVFNFMYIFFIIILKYFCLIVGVRDVEK